MPRYDFQCDECGRREEWFLTFEQFDTTKPMCCAQQMRQVFHPPALQTDTRFQIGQGETFDEQTPGGKAMAQRRINGARKAGVNPNGGAWYCSQIGPPDDPDAWVHDRSDIKRVCRKRGYGCEQLGIKAEEYRGEDPFSQPYQPDDQLVRADVEQELKGTDATPSERESMVAERKVEMAGTPVDNSPTIFD